MKYSDINIDFNILDSGDPRVLLVADSSYWQLIEDQVSIIEVTLPGETTPVVQYFTKNGITNLNSVNLNINCPNAECEDVELLPLDDGIYTITVKGVEPYHKTKKHLRTTKFELALGKLYIDLFSNGCEVCQDKKDMLIEIEFLIKAAKANLRTNDICTSQELFYEAQKLLDSTMKCKTCN